MSLQGREELQSVYSMVWRKLGGKSWCGGIEHSRWPWKIVFDMWPHLGKGVLRWKAFKCVFTSNMFKRCFNVSLCRFNASLMHLKTTMCLKCPNVLTRFNVPIIITFSCQNIISQIINPGTPCTNGTKINVTFLGCTVLYSLYYTWKGATPMQWGKMIINLHEFCH